MSELTTETLRAELGQLELRIVDRLGKALDGKADQSQLNDLRKQVQALDRDKADEDDLTSVRKKIDDVNTRLLVFAFTVAASSVGVATTIVLTLGGNHP